MHKGWTLSLKIDLKNKLWRAKNLVYFKDAKWKIKCSLLILYYFLLSPSLVSPLYCIIFFLHWLVNTPNSFCFIPLNFSLPTSTCLLRATVLFIFTQEAEMQTNTGGKWGEREWLALLLPFLWIYHDLPNCAISSPTHSILHFLFSSNRCCRAAKNYSTGILRKCSLCFDYLISLNFCFLQYPSNTRLEPLPHGMAKRVCLGRLQRPPHTSSRPGKVSDIRELEHAITDQTPLEDVLHLLRNELGR